MLRHAILGASCLIVALVAASAAMADCNYDPNSPINNCSGAIRDYFQQTTGSQGQSYEDVEKRVNSAKDTLNECTSCAMDYIQRGTDSAQPSESPDDGSTSK